MVVEGRTKTPAMLTLLLQKLATFLVNQQEVDLFYQCGV